MKALSKLTKKMDKKIWADHVNLKDMSIDDMLDLWSDMKTWESVGKDVGGYMKTALMARLPDGQESFSNTHVTFDSSESPGRQRWAMDRMREDMGDQFMEKYSEFGNDFTTVKHTRT